MGKPKKHIKLFEFLSVFSTAVGITIGIGIYLKNDNEPGHVLGFTQNPFLAIALWILVGILGMAMIMVFIEVSSANTKSGHGTLASWANLFIGRKVASYYAIFYIFLYFPTLLTFFAMFSVNAMFIALNLQNVSEETKNIVTVIVGFIFLILIALSNIFFRKTGKAIQTIGTFIKFIPLLVSLFIGFIHPIDGNVFDTFKDIKFGNFFMGLLPVLFSFDGFIYGASLQKEVSNKNVVPKALFAAMVFITIFYLLEVISLFLGTNDGSVFSLFNNVLGTGIGSKILNWFIVITALMSLHAMTLVAPASMQASREENLIYLGKKELKMWVIGAVQIAVTVTVGAIMMAISLPVKHDALAIVDTFSNATSLTVFVLYLMLIVAVCVNRKTGKVEVNKIKGLWYYAVFSIAILSLSLAYIAYMFFAFKENFETMISIFIVLGTSFGLWGINELLLKKGMLPPQNKVIFNGPEKKLATINANS
ncbi:APC family permease [Spiroplasma syrphidicola]|nr:APC family permease [Spiroplasma syrphidicola]